jgi:hypothetical protein
MDKTSKQEPPAWVEPFLAALRGGSAVREATRQLGIDPSSPYHRRREDPAFHAAWFAIRPFKERSTVGGVPPRPYGEARLDRFLTQLAETSNVSAAAETAAVSVGQVYKLRRDDPEFARRWYAALAEGYDNLEMELLGRLRAGENGEAVHGSAPDKRKFDTAAALRCLAAHRESVAREKGRRALAEEVATIAAINAKIDRLRLASEESEQAIKEARKAKRLAARKAAKALPSLTGGGDA